VWPGCGCGGGAGGPSKLTKAQRERLAAIIEAGPEAAGFPTGGWHALLTQQVILREFGVSYNVHYLATLLHSLGFSFQKARFVSDHLDAVARAAWLAYTFPAWRAQAEAAGGLLLFGDEASFAQWGSLGSTWARVGRQPVVKTTGRRKAYKVFGLIEYFSGRLFYQGIDGRFNGPGYVAFLTRVLEQTTAPLFLVQDGAPYHRAAPVKAFVEQHRDRLHVIPAPQLLAGLQPDRVPVAGHQARRYPQPLLPRVRRPDRLGRGGAGRLRGPAGPRQGRPSATTSATCHRGAAEAAPALRCQCRA
jgi:hypothetical protein